MKTYQKMFNKKRLFKMNNKINKKMFNNKKKYNKNNYSMKYNCFKQEDFIIDLLKTYIYIKLIYYFLRMIKNNNSANSNNHFKIINSKNNVNKSKLD